MADEEMQRQLQQQQLAFKCGDLRWKWIWRVQSYGGLVAHLIIVLPLLLLFVNLDANNDRDFWTEDVRFNYPYKPDTISIIAIAVLQIGLLLLTILPLELWMMKSRHKDINRAMATIFVIIFDLVCAVITVQLFFSIGNVLTGIQRPNWLDVCKPDPNLPLLTKNPACTSTNSAKILSSRRSFPSGHVAFSMCIAIYNSAYIVWRLYISKYGANMRPIITADFPQFPNKTMISEIQQGFWSVFAIVPTGMCWLFMLSRIMDNKHSTSDTNGGLLCAILFVFPYFLRTIGYLEDEFARKIRVSPHCKEEASIASPSRGAHQQHAIVNVEHGVRSPMRLTTEDNAMGGPRNSKITDIEAGAGVGEPDVRM